MKNAEQHSPIKIYPSLLSNLSSMDGDTAGCVQKLGGGSAAAQLNSSQVSTILPQIWKQADAKLWQSAYAPVESTNTNSSQLRWEEKTPGHDAALSN